MITIGLFLFVEIGWTAGMDEILRSLYLEVEENNLN